MTRARDFADLAAGITTADLPTGSVLQVKQSVKTDTFSTTSQTAVDVTGLTVAITPISTSSKILISAHVYCSGDAAVDSIVGFLGKGGSVISSFIADTASNRPRGAMHQFSGDGAASATNNEMYLLSTECLDSPSTTSATTYSVMIRVANGNTGYINRTIEDRDTANFDPRAISTITVKEIAG